jgi:cell wall-associated NlpC family hydrolase
LGRVPQAEGSALVGDGTRRKKPVLMTVAALGAGTALGIAGVLVAVSGGGPGHGAARHAAARPATARHATAAGAGSSALFQVPAGSPVSGAQLTATAGRPLVKATAAASAAPAARAVAPLGKLHPADLLAVAPATLRPAVVAAIAKLPGVTATNTIDAAAIQVNGQFVQMLGVSPDTFRSFAATPTAKSTPLWSSVAGGGIAVSYTMGKLDKLPLGGSVTVAGTRRETLRVGAFGTVGIAGVDAVVSDPVARSLGIPAGNAVVISAPSATLPALSAKVKALLPHGAGVAQLVVQALPGGAAQRAIAGAAGGGAGAASDGTMTSPELEAFLQAALSRVGLPYVWGAAGPSSFDCSGLVQWSMRQAGLVMPRVAADQARTGPLIPLADLRPGDLLFYHTDVTAPSYISHVAIYLGNGEMEQAPEPGMDVQVVRADFGPAFAGAVQVAPSLAAAVAGDPAG